MNRETSAAHLTDVFVFLEPGPPHDIKSSALYWSPALARARPPEQLRGETSITNCEP